MNFICCKYFYRLQLDDTLNDKNILNKITKTNSFFQLPDCDCDRRGTVGSSSVCDGESGMCVCKAFTQSRRCDQCERGTFNLQDYNFHGCTGTHFLIRHILGILGSLIMSCLY